MITYSLFLIGRANPVNNLMRQTELLLLGIFPAKSKMKKYFSIIITKHSAYLKAADNFQERIKTHLKENKKL